MHKEIGHDCPKGAIELRYVVGICHFKVVHYVVPTTLIMFATMSVPSIAVTITRTTTLSY